MTLHLFSLTLLYLLLSRVIGVSIVSRLGSKYRIDPNYTPVFVKERQRSVHNTMPSCVVKDCSNHILKFNKKKDNISYHRFPSEAVRCEVWNRIIRQQRGEPYFKSHKDSRVCSKHFPQEDFYTTKTGLRKLKSSTKPKLLLERKTFATVATIEGEELPLEVTLTQDVGHNSNNENIIDVDISDLESIFDTPREVNLKCIISKYKQRNLKKNKTIRNLRTQNAWFKKRNKKLVEIIKQLKCKRNLHNEIDENLLIPETHLTTLSE